MFPLLGHSAKVFGGITQHVEQSTHSAETSASKLHKAMIYISCAFVLFMLWRLPPPTSSGKPHCRNRGAVCCSLAPTN
eukprot:712825-Pyramimonas_sp.AAC.1